MFARRPITATPAPVEASFRLPAVFANPWAMPAGAAGLLFGSVALFVMVTANPHAGAPSVKMTLDGGAGAKGPLALHPGLPGGPDGAATTLTSLAPGQDVAMPGAPDPLAAQIGGSAFSSGGGQAVITLPQGASLGGGNATQIAAPAVPARPKAPPLAQAPIAGLTAPGPGGLLPIIGRDGRTPFQAYARPFASNGKPKVAIVVGALGLNATATRAAIEKLQPEVTLSFTPYADGLQAWIDLARANGHEVMVEIPMEPLDYPANDPGPSTLMAGAPGGEITHKLEGLLTRATGYFAVTNYMGGRFMSSDTAMSALIASLRSRGVGFVDDGTAGKRGGGGTPRASADSVIDDDPSASAIDGQLLKLEAGALQHGQSLGSGFAYALTIDKVTRWAAGLAGRGYQLAPASAVMRK